MKCEYKNAMNYSKDPDQKLLILLFLGWLRVPQPTVIQIGGHL
jgi:hypothetical protein